ncbi:hypothetical protein BDV93DRAFT_550634 [Ceratobasidium sp. AG-I]|nr:hypothetical protein BDV93DRAFT_550634 [Ceratobasidium sp. AG-I]
MATPANTTVSASQTTPYRTRCRTNSLMRPPTRQIPSPSPPPPPRRHRASATPAPPSPLTPVKPPAPHLLFGSPSCSLEFPPPQCVHRIAQEDARDKVLMAICAALAHVENRALTPRQIVDVVHQTGIIKLGSLSSRLPRALRVPSGNTPASTVSTHIRSHLARGTPQLLLRHSLLPRPRHPSDAPSIEDRAVGPSADGSAERKKGTAWYLSEDAGFASPWDRLGIPTPKEPESDPADPLVPPSPVASVVSIPASTPAPTTPMDSTRVSSRKRTRTKSWSAAARELGMDGMSPAPDYDDESEAEAHRERKSKVRIRLRLGSSSVSRSSSARPEDPQPLSQPGPEPDDSDQEPAPASPVVVRRPGRPALPPPLRNRVFSAPCPQLTHFRRSLSNTSSGGPSTPHALTFVDAEDSDVEDGDFHVRMMSNPDSTPSSPRKSPVEPPIVGIGLGLIFEEEGRGVKLKVKEEHDSSMSPPSLSSRASSLAASSLPEDDVWAVKIEEAEDVVMTHVALEPEPCETGLGFEWSASYEGFEAEFALLGVHSPTIVPNLFLREPGHMDGPESVCVDEVDGIWAEWGEKPAHIRSKRRDGKANTRTSKTNSKPIDSSWGCRAPHGMRVSLNAAKSRVCSDSVPRGVVLQKEELQIERTVLHGIEYASCVVRGCVLLRRMEDSSVSLSALLRACRVPGSCHAQFRTEGTVDASTAEAGDKPVVETSTLAPTSSATSTTTAQPSSSPARPSLESDTTPLDVLHTAPSSSEILHPQATSIDFGMGVEMPDPAGMWCPLADARAVAEERLRPYLPESVRKEFLADVVVLREVETKMEVEESKMDVEDSETKTREEDSSRDETPSATAPTTDEPVLEKAPAASEDDISVFVRPSSPATVPCATRRVLRTRPARVARTRTRAA